MEVPMSHYWRHPALAHLEIRNVEDGRTFSHARHSHSTFSIGAIMQGQSTYLNGDSSRLISAGSVVLMNPGVVHACNPVHEQPWAYRMFYVDAQWLATLQQPGSGTQKDFVPFAQTYSADVSLFDELDDLYRTLTASDCPPNIMQGATLGFFQRLVKRLQPVSNDAKSEPHKMAQAAEFIREHCADALRLEDIASAVQLSPSYLIRAFKACHGLTPHGYLIDCRLKLARDGLRPGEDIAQVAARVGFADQAHLQRLFKRALATTPGHYRGVPTQAIDTPRSPRAARP
ncbi:AraC family transcriptional regulator [Pseudomonas sp. MBT-2]|uniref:AraC family transcriptional regulator n=2 Tax=Pseudomonas baltica TaxID=2762576 RepID=A0A7X1G5P3_9PSED|nr:AraC family transcriptional regulator [Pseudomonas baltica]